MFLKLLALGAAGAGVYFAYKMLSEQDDGAKGEAPPPGTPEVPEMPPGVIQLSGSDFRSMYGEWGGSDLFVVAAVAQNMNRPGITLPIFAKFGDEHSAMVYADQLVEYFDRNSEHWTCPKGTGSVSVDVVKWSDSGWKTLYSGIWANCSPQGYGFSGSEQPPVSGGQLDKPIYIVSYQIRSGFQDSKAYMFKSDKEAEAWYETLQAFLLQDPIRMAYTWPQGTVTVEKYGTPPAAARFTMVDNSGVIAST